MKGASLRYIKVTNYQHILRNIMNFLSVYIHKYIYIVTYLSTGISFMNLMTFVIPVTDRDITSSVKI